MDFRGRTVSEIFVNGIGLRQVERFRLLGKAKFMNFLSVRRYGHGTFGRNALDAVT